MKKYHFKVNDLVIVTVDGDGFKFTDNKIFNGIIHQIDYHPTLSEMYRINDDDDGEYLGRFYHHQLKLNKPLIREYKLKHFWTTF